MPHERITATTIPAPPARLALILPLGLGLAAFVALFVLPPCASSPRLDLAVLGALGLRAACVVVRLLGRPRRHTGSPRLPPRVALPPAEVGSRPPDGR